MELDLKCIFGSEPPVIGNAHRIRLEPDAYILLVRQIVQKGFHIIRIHEWIRDLQEALRRGALIIDGEQRHQTTHQTLFRVKPLDSICERVSVWLDYIQQSKANQVSRKTDRWHQQRVALIYKHLEKDLQEFQRFMDHLNDIAEGSRLTPGTLRHMPTVVRFRKLLDMVEGEPHKLDATSEPQQLVSVLSQKLRSQMQKIRGLADRIPDTFSSNPEVLFDRPELSDKTLENEIFFLNALSTFLVLEYKIDAAAEKWVPFQFEAPSVLGPRMNATRRGPTSFLSERPAIDNHHRKRLLFWHVYDVCVQAVLSPLELRAMSPSERTERLRGLLDTRDQDNLPHIRLLKRLLERPTKVDLGMVQALNSFLCFSREKRLASRYMHEQWKLLSEQDKKEVYRDLLRTVRALLTPVWNDTMFPPNVYRMLVQPFPFSTKTPTRMALDGYPSFSSTSSSHSVNAVPTTPEYTLDTLSYRVFLFAKEKGTLRIFFQTLRGTNGSFLRKYPVAVANAMQPMVELQILEQLSRSKEVVPEDDFLGMIREAVKNLLGEQLAGAQDVNKIIMETMKERLGPDRWIDWDSPVVHRILDLPGRVQQGDQVQRLLFQMRVPNGDLDSFEGAKTLLQGRVISKSVLDVLKQ